MINNIIKTIQFLIWLISSKNTCHARHTNLQPY